MGWRGTVALMMPFLILAGPTLGESLSEPLEIPNCRISVIRRAALSGERSGVLQEISVVEGDIVKSGQVIATLRDDLPRQALAIAQKEAGNTVELRLARKISEQATLEFSKAAELNRSIPGGIAEIELKKLRLSAEKALLQMEQADFQLQLAELRKNESEAVLKTYRITAPFSGVVLQVDKQPGEAMSPGETAVEIANFDVMRIEGFVPVAVAAQLRPGSTVIVEVAKLDPQRPNGVVRLEGRLKHVAPLVNEVSQQVRVRAEVANRDELLKDGFSATMRVSVTKPPRQSIALPPLSKN